MKKVLGLVGATLLFAGPALAADLAVKAPALAGPLPAQWSGFYLGIHGGYGWGHDSTDADFSPFPTPSDPSPKGGVFGGQAGYNWQYGSVVAGLEIDFSGADLKDSSSSTLVLGQRVSITSTLSSKIDYFGSARARAGFLLMPDWLLYGTAGLGWAHDSITASITETVGTRSESISATGFSDHFGWTAGGGVEYRLWQNLLLRAEYLHYGFGSASYGDVVNSKLSIDVVRGGLSYKF
jgi:opacity protein-like surface antigen